MLNLVHQLVTIEHLKNKLIKIAILQTGYADVVPFDFSNNGFVEYNNFKFIF